MPYFTIALIVLATLAGYWRVFEKDGRPGRAAIVPVYSSLMMLRIAGRPNWWIFLMLIPFIDIVFGALVWMDILDRFSKPAWHVVFVVFVPFA